MTQANQQEVYNQVKDALIELFELDAEDITPEAHLYLDKFS